MNQELRGKVCPYCKKPFAEGDEVIFCHFCGTPHHAACWHENEGCTTAGCAGVMAEAKQAAGKAAEPQKSAPEKKPEEPEKEKLLFESREMVFQANDAVALEAVSVTGGEGDGAPQARCMFRCITDRPIQSVQVEITCRDEIFHALGQPVVHTYENLQTRRESRFGGNESIDLPERETRRIQAAVKQVVFADGTSAEGGEYVAILPAPVRLEDRFHSAQIAAEYARQTTPGALYVPLHADQYWQCTCGAINRAGEAKCHQCGCSRDLLSGRMNPDTLFSDRKKRRKKPKKQEKLKKAPAEPEKKNHRRRKSSGKKTLLIILICLLAAAGIACGVIFFGVPYVNYRTACEALQNQEFDEAYEGFVRLDGFLNSRKKAELARYRKAEECLKAGSFDEAIRIFGELGDYKDSPAQVSLSRYRKAESLLKAGDFDGAARIFEELGDYEDSPEKCLETAYEKALHLLETGDFDGAIRIFTELGGYRDSADRVLQAGCAKGADLLEQGKYEEAIEVYSGLGGYGDSSQRIREARYAIASELLEQEDYEAAARILSELEGYEDSGELLKEALYQLALRDLDSGAYEEAALALSELEDYRDSRDLCARAESLQAQELMQEGSFREAYELLAQIGPEYDVKEHKEDCLLAWAKVLLSEVNEKETEAFLDTVAPEDIPCEAVYEMLLEEIQSYPAFAHWNGSGRKNAAKPVLQVLRLLPGDCRDTEELTALFAGIDGGDLAEGREDLFIRTHSETLRTLWHLGMVRDFLTQCRPCTFVEGRWTTEDGKHFLEFKTDEENGSTCTYDLPAPEAPAEAEGFDIRNLCCLLTDSGGEELVKLFQFEFKSYDEISIYCFENGETYVMHR